MCLSALFVVALVVWFLYCAFIPQPARERSGCAGERGRRGKRLLPPGSVIPAVLCKTGPFEPENLPESTSALFQEFLQNNPDYTLDYYSDARAEAYVRDNFPASVLHAYHSLVPGAFKADLFRYCWLYHSGGVYGDMSQRYLVPMGQLVDRATDELVLVGDKAPLLHLGRTQNIQIAFMAAPPGHPVYWQAIQQIVENVRVRAYGCSHLYPTGPSNFARALEFFRGCRLRMDMYQGPCTLLTVCDGQVAVITRHGDHRKHVKRDKNHYSQAWYRGRVYQSVPE